MKHASSVRWYYNNLDKLSFQEVPFRYSSRLVLGLKEIFCMRFGRQKFNKSLISQTYLLWGRKAKGCWVREILFPRALVVPCPWSRRLHLRRRLWTCFTRITLLLLPQLEKRVYLPQMFMGITIDKVHKSVGPSETEAPRNFSLLH